MTSITFEFDLSEQVGNRCTKFALVEEAREEEALSDAKISLVRPCPPVTCRVTRCYAHAIAFEDLLEPPPTCGSFVGVGQAVPLHLAQLENFGYGLR